MMILQHWVTSLWLLACLLTGSEARLGGERERFLARKKDRGGRMNKKRGGRGGRNGATAGCCALTEGGACAAEEDFTTGRRCDRNARKCQACGGFWVVTADDADEEEAPCCSTDQGMTCVTNKKCNRNAVKCQAVCEGSWMTLVGTTTPATTTVAATTESTTESTIEATTSASTTEATTRATTANMSEEKENALALTLDSCQNGPGSADAHACYEWLNAHNSRRWDFHVAARRPKLVQWDHELEGWARMWASQVALTCQAATSGIRSENIWVGTTPTDPEDVLVEWFDNEKEIAETQNPLVGTLVSHFAEAAYYGTDTLGCAGAVAQACNDFNYVRVCAYGRKATCVVDYETPVWPTWKEDILNGPTCHT